MKNKKILIIGIVISVIVIACGISIFLHYRNIETNVGETNNIDTVDNKLAEKKQYIGTYKNGNGEEIKITMNKSKAIEKKYKDKLILENYTQSDYILSFPDKEDNGSILAYRWGDGVNDLYCHLYPIGTKLELYNHEQQEIQTTDSNKIRILFTGSDVPDIRYNVYTKVD